MAGEPGRAPTPAAAMVDRPSSCLERLEASAFALLNAVVEPLVRAGVGSPGAWPWGAIVLETRGRQSGRVVSVPVLAMLVGDLLVVATARPRSQWLKNLAAGPDVHYWRGGQRHRATALVVTPDGPRVQPAPSSPAGDLALALRSWSRMWGISLAVLSPGHARTA